MKLGALSALILWLAILPQQGAAQESPLDADRRAHTEALDMITPRLKKDSLVPNEAPGRVLGMLQQEDRPLKLLSEEKLFETLRASHLTAEHSAALWAFFADLDNVSKANLSIVKALIGATDTPKAREALWSELSGLAHAFISQDRSHLREQSLLGLFERNRDVLLPLFAEMRETESSCDEMIELMLTSRVFAAELDESVAYVSERIPAAVARYIDRQRGLGRSVSWEATAFEGVVRWKDARLVSGGAKAPRSLLELDAAGETFVTMLSWLHKVGGGFREMILRGLGPVDLFNAVVAGKSELYRLDNSDYRTYLHTIIMRGIVESGSFEAFLERAVPRRLGEDACNRVREPRLRMRSAARTPSLSWSRRGARLSNRDGTSASLSDSEQTPPPAVHRCPTRRSERFGFPHEFHALLSAVRADREKTSGPLGSSTT